MIKMIVAMDKTNQAIGNKNKLLWDLPEDMKFFRETTKNTIVVMGYNTYKSIGKPLPKRLNIVLSQNNKEENTENLIFYNNFDKLLEDLKNIDKTIFIIGGSQIYRLFLPYTEELYVTLIHKQNEELFEADTYFPNFKNDFTMINSSDICLSEKQNLYYQFTCWKNNNK